MEEESPNRRRRRRYKNMGRENIFVGLEVGTSKICVAVAEAHHDGTLKILGVGNAPSRGVRKGEIVDFETAKRCVHDAIVDAEEKSDVEISEVYLGITGRRANQRA
jgi:cell division protein FtsA